jgi:hypothetical protein
MGVTYIAQLNVNRSTQTQSASPLLPPGGQGVEQEVLHVNV